MKTLFAILAALTLPLMGAGKAVEKPEKKESNITVGGHVGRPGVLEYREKTTLFAMIFAAGGPTEFASMKRVKVYREGETLEFDLTKEKEKNEALAKPGDTIEVPMMTPFGR